jgi:hypothetical protein
LGQCGIAGFDDAGPTDDTVLTRDCRPPCITEVCKNPQDALGRVVLAQSLNLGPQEPTPERGCEGGEVMPGWYIHMEAARFAAERLQNGDVPATYGLDPTEA